MWKLKQIPVATHTFSKTDTLESILKYLLKDYPQFTVATNTETTFGNFTVGNETVAEALSRLRKTYRFESYFRGNTLFSGSLVYTPLVPKVRTFTFQSKVDYGAIISDELEYKRKDDIVLSAVASNTIEEKTGKTTKDGHEKTKKTRLEVLVTLRNGSDEPEVFIKPANGDFPANTGGERRTFFFPGATSIEKLKELATAELKKYYYTGFKGKFVTFGIPFTRMGDNVQIIDPILPERNGLYKVRGVEYSGGVNGLRQTIELDYLIRQ
jgi:hypothetical protein